jgi:hypothetical protein
MSEATPPQRKPGAFSDAADRIRDSAKWLLGAFAAVGALLAAGLQLADLGKLASDRSDHRLQWAILGVVAAVLGISIAIGASASVITRSFVTLKWLTEKKRRRTGLDGDAVLLANHSDVPELYRKAIDALEAQRLAVQEWEASPTDAKLSVIAQKADAVRYYDLIIVRVVEQASYRKLSRGYSWARAFMLLGAVVAAGGITLFAWAAHPPPDQKVATVVKTPTDVMVTFTHQGIKHFAGRFGKKCDLKKQVAAVAVRDIGADYDIVIVPTKNCSPALVRVTAHDAIVVPDSGS